MKINIWSIRIPHKNSVFTALDVHMHTPLSYTWEKERTNERERERVGSKNTHNMHSSVTQIFLYISIHYTDQFSLIHRTCIPVLYKYVFAHQRCWSYFVSLFSAFPLVFHFCHLTIAWILCLCIAHYICYWYISMHALSKTDRQWSDWDVQLSI